MLCSNGNEVVSSAPEVADAPAGGDVDVDGVDASFSAAATSGIVRAEVVFVHR